MNPSGHLKKIDLVLKLDNKFRLRFRIRFNARSRSKAIWLTVISQQFKIVSISCETLILLV